MAASWSGAGGLGDVIASIASIQGALYLVVLSVNSVIAVGRGLSTGSGELPVWGTLAVVMTASALMLLTEMRQECARET